MTSARDLQAMIDEATERVIEACRDYELHRITTRIEVSKAIEELLKEVGGRLVSL